MKNIALGGLLSVLALTLLSIIPVHTANAVTYNAGVAVGNSFTYQFAINWNTSSPPPGSFNGFNTATLQITRVSGSIVNGTGTLTFTNGTAPKPSALSGDVSTGSGNLTFILIPAGLNSGDSFKFGSNTVTVNSTSTVTALGASRTVDLLNFSYTFGSYYFHEGFAWDKATGALLSLVFTESIPGPPPGHGGFSVLLTGTNVWSANILGLPPIIFYAIIGIIIVVVAAAAVYILRKGRHPKPPAQPAPVTQSPSP